MLVSKLLVMIVLTIFEEESFVTKENKVALNIGKYK